MSNALVHDGIYEILNPYDEDKYVTIKTKPFKIGHTAHGANDDSPCVAYSHTLTDAKKKRYSGYDFFNMETQQAGARAVQLILSEELTKKKKSGIIDTSIVEKHSIWELI